MLDKIFSGVELTTVCRTLTLIDKKQMKKGPDIVVILVLVFVVGFVITGVSKTSFELASTPKSQIQG
jgi:hypothetical protein